MNVNRPTIRNFNMKHYHNFQYETVTSIIYIFKSSKFIMSQIYIAYMYAF